MATQQGTAQTTRQLLQERGANATRDLRKTLQLVADVNDTSILGTALAEAAIEESRHNPRFADDIRRRYDEMMGMRNTPTKRTTPKAKEPLPPLVPIGRVAHTAFDPFAPPDPHFLTQVYGRHQLVRALQDYSVESLKRTVAALEARHPGTKPTNRGRKDPLIAYIVEQYDSEQNQ